MEKRSILRKMNPIKAETKTPASLEQAELNDDDFEKDIKPIDAPKARENPPKEKPPVKSEVLISEKTKRMHLDEARKKSLETRRRKKEENLRLKIQAEELAKQLEQQRKQYEELRFNQTQIREPTPSPAPAPTPKEKVIEEEPKQKISKTETPMPIPSTREADIDYNKLADMIYGKFKFAEDDIRIQERKMAEREYQEKLKEYEDRQAALRKQQTQRIPIYSQRKPNRAFDMTNRGNAWRN